MTTPEQRQYNHEYEGVDNDTLKKIAQDVRDWDTAYSTEGKIERSLRKIEKHQESIVAWTKKTFEYADRARRHEEFLREREVNAAELAILQHEGVDITNTVAYKNIRRDHIWGEA